MKRTLFLFVTGGWLYPGLELLWRRKTHLSMAMAGGVSLCLIDKICNGRFQNKCMPVRCIAGSGIITGVEFFTGLIVNIAGKKHVWDYSSMPFNLMGQICLPFSVMWCGLTIPAMWLCKHLRFTPRDGFSGNPKIPAK